MRFFDLQRFANINTAASGTVLSSAQVQAGKDSLGNDITSYVKAISGSDTTITVTKGSGDTYAVTLSGGSSGSGGSTSPNLANATGILSTAHGGLGSSVMATARTNLGLGSIATLSSPLPVANGGTGQTLLANVLGVGSATKASQDASGNVITSSYLRKNTSDTLSGSLVVTSTGSIGSNLSVQGGIRSAGTVTMAGAASVGTSLTVAGAASVGTSLTVAGGESLTGNLRVGGNVTVTGDESIGGNATITGNLRLKGSGNYGNKLNLGDGEYVYLYEPADDQLEIKAKQISLTSSNSNQVWVNGTNITALGGGSGGDASTATKLATARALKVSLASSSTQNFDGSANCTLIGVGGVLPVANGGTGTTTATPMFYGTCSTAAGTAAKAVTCSGFVLTTGAQITVKFSATSTASSPTLNVNSTGAKTIQYQGYSLVSGALRANGCYHFVYDGSYWQVVGPLVWTE